MIAEKMRKGLSLTGREIFSSSKEDTSVLGITESSRDDKLLINRIIPVESEFIDFNNKLNITLDFISLESPQDLTQIHEFPRMHYFLADANKLEAFIVYVRQKLEERDLMVRELQFEIEKLNKKRKFSSAGFRLPKDYYENDAYIVE